LAARRLRQSGSRVPFIGIVEQTRGSLQQFSSLRPTSKHVCVMTVEVGISKGIRELGFNKEKTKPGDGKNLSVRFKIGSQN
jgi:hypothetical protein